MKRLGSPFQNPSTPFEIVPGSRRNRKLPESLERMRSNLGREVMMTS
jgi:hypothetical protein